MDGISAAASVASLAAVGVSLSKTLYDVVATINGGKEEIKDIANNVSLLALVLDQLQDVLGRERPFFRPALEQNAQIIVSRCETIFNDIALHTGSAKGVSASRLVWYFRRERVKPLRASLESLKSTLNIVLHIVQLAKTTQEAKTNASKDYQEGPIRRERRSLVYQVIDNRLSIEKLKVLEEEVLQGNFAIDVDGLPFMYDGTSPLPDIFHRKVKSDEEFEFVPATTSPADDMWQSHLLERPDETTNRSRSQAPDPHEGKFSKQERVAQPASPSGQAQETKNPLQEAAPIKRFLPQPLTSTLIMSVIPHGRADKVPQSPMPDSESEQLEYKAESTLETLLEEWTNVGHQESSSDHEEPQAKSTRFRDHSESKRSTQDRLAEKSDSYQAGAPSYLPDDEFVKGSKGDPEVPGTILDEASSMSEIPDHAQESPDDDAKATRATKGILEDGGESLPPKVGPRKSNRDKKPAHAHTVKKEGRHSNTLPISEHTVSSNRTQSSDAHMYNYPVQPQYPYPYYPAMPHASAYHRPQVSNSTVPPNPTPASAPAPAPIVNVVPFDTSHLGSARGSNDDSTEKIVYAMEKAFNFLERPTLARGALEAEHHKLQEECRLKAALDNLKQKEAAAEQAALNSRPVTLQDCLGRKYIFPLEMCRTWIAMEGLVRRRFSPYDALGSRVYMKEYDLLSPTGEIILPEAWECLIKPGWALEMRLWPMPGSDQRTKESTSRYGAPAYGSRLPLMLTSGSSKHSTSRDEVSSAASSSSGRRSFSIRTMLSGRKSRTQSVNDSD